MFIIGMFVIIWLSNIYQANFLIIQFLICVPNITIFWTCLILQWSNKNWIVFVNITFSSSVKLNNSVKAFTINNFLSSFFALISLW